MRDNFSQLKYVEIISPNKKIDKNYFLKKDEDLHNKSETSIYPFMYSFCGSNTDKIDGIKRDGVSDATLMKNDLYIHLLIFQQFSQVPLTLFFEQLIQQDTLL